MHESIADIDYREVIEYALEPLIVHSKLEIIYINGAAEKFFRASKEKVIGASPLDIFRDSSKKAIEERISGAYNRPAEVIEETIYRMDGTTVDVELYCHPVKIGDLKAIQTYVRDISKKRKLERDQSQMVKQINELASTVVPVFEGIAILPLLGSIDEGRARAILEVVPFNVQKHNIECLVIDFSGTQKLDAIVVDYLLKIAQVLKLLGVKPILAGLRPDLALGAIEIGINLDDLLTVSTVKDALHILGVTYNAANMK